MTQLAQEERSFAAQTEDVAEHGAVLFVPLNRLKKSPRNVRRVEHSVDDVEEMAASIAAKAGTQPSQPPVVEPEIVDGQPTGFYLVTAGECRRLGLALLAKRKTIRKTHPIRCLLDTVNDPAEVSLDENITRTGLHPADEFAAFRRLADERGLSAEQIGPRFGRSAQHVQQRLRLGAVAPALMDLYRAGSLTLDQMMAFSVSEDHERQVQVLEQYGPDRPAYAIRRAMTESKVSAQDRRAAFVRAEAYAEAGGTILRDLFTEDGGGWFEDVGLLDQLAVEKLTALAEETREREGWKWAEARIDYPHAEGLARVYPHRVERSDAEAAEITALGEEYDAIVSEHDGAEEWPAEVEARLSEIEAALAAFGGDHAYDADEIARGGLFVILGQDGAARVERGFVRPEDELAPEPELDVEDGERPGALPAAGTAAPTIEAEDEMRPRPWRIVWCWT